MATVLEWLEENKGKYTDRRKLIDDCVKKLSVSRKSVENVIPKVWPIASYKLSSPPSVKKSSSAKSKMIGMTKTQFREKYDFNTKIRKAIVEGIKLLSDGQGDKIVPDSEFRVELCGNVAANGFRQIANEEKFRKYQFRSKGEIFWSTPKGKQWALEEVSSARDL